MLQDDQEHLRLIVRCLEEMKVRSAPLGCEVLQGGISGSHTYRFELNSQPVVLKVAVAGSEPYIWERARREHQFYHTLAERVPLRVPRLLSSYAADDFGICVLLAAYRPANPAQSWEEGDYLQVAEQLAGFHAAFWGRAGDLADYPWLRKPAPGTEASQVKAARGAWRDLLGQERFQGAVAEGSVRALDAGLERIAEVDAFLRTFPTTLCHGDCHIDNLLRDPQGELVWADWQEVGVGRGPEDLSFLLQRAFPAGEGSAALIERVIAAYQAHLEARSGARIPLAAVRQVIDGSELSTRLLQWPFYLTQAPREWVLGMLTRIEQLVERL